jgi:SAM-dependent methyltransferase
VSAEFRDHFSPKAAEYAASRPTYPSELVDFLADASPRRRLAWDAGAGSGQLSVLLANRFERVIATDASVEQLAHAVPHPRVEYRRARAEDSIGLEGGAVDLAVSAQAAHWFDLDEYYREVRRVAAPDALVALVSYGVAEIEGDSVNAVFRRFHDVVLGEHWPPERLHVEAGYRSLPFPFVEIATPKLVLRVRWTLEELEGYVDTWSALRSLLREGGQPRLAAFRRELALAWGGPSAPREVRWPLSIRAARVGSAASG